MLQVGELVGHNDARLALQAPLEHVLEDVRPHVHVDGGEGVVEKVDVTVGVAGAGQADPLLLPSGKVDAAVADLDLVAAFKDLQVAGQRAVFNDGIVPAVEVVDDEEEEEEVVVVVVVVESSSRSSSGSGSVSSRQTKRKERYTEGIRT